MQSANRIANGTFGDFNPYLYELSPLVLYEQYKGSKLLTQVFERINYFIKTNYIDYLKELSNAMSVNGSKDIFLAFYMRNYFGIERPLGSASMASYYDIEEQFDIKNVIYDEAAEYDGKIGILEFKKYIRFILDYENEVLNIPTLASFAARWIECKLSDIMIIQSIDTTTFYIPQTFTSGEFIKLIFAYAKPLNLPYGAKIEFRYKNTEVAPEEDTTV